MSYFIPKFHQNLTFHQQLYTLVNHECLISSHHVQVGKVGFPHRLTKEDAMKWFQTKYDGVILSSKAK